MNCEQETQNLIAKELGKPILKLLITFALVEFHLDKTPFRDNKTGTCEVT